HRSLEGAMGTGVGEDLDQQVAGVDVIQGEWTRLGQTQIAAVGLGNGAAEGQGAEALTLLEVRPGWLRLGGNPKAQADEDKQQKTPHGWLLLLGATPGWRQ